MKSLATFVLFVLVGFVSAQNIAINTDGSSPDPSAILELKSDNRGLLIPRMTTVLRDAIVSPAEALLIYNTDTDCFNVYDTTSYSWRSFCPDLSGANCPAGMVDLGDFSIEQIPHSPSNFFTAVVLCKNLGPGARLCSIAEWYFACQSGLIPSMGTNDEWVDDFAHNDNVLTIGGNSCDDTEIRFNENITVFRCCCGH